MSTLLDLTRMNQIPVEYTLDGMRALRNAEQTDQVNLQELMRRQAHEQQMDPLRVQQAQLANLGTGQKIAEGEYGLSTLGRKDQMERDLFGATQQAKLKELLAGASDNDAKMFENELYKRLQSTRPGTKEHAAASKALEATRGFISHKQKMSELAVGPNTSGYWQHKINRENIEAGKYKDKTTLKLSFDDQMAKAKNAIQQKAIWDTWAAIAQTNPQEYSWLIPILNDMLPRIQERYAIEAPNMQPKPGEVDLGATAPGIATTPNKPTLTPRPVVPTAPAAPAASAPTAPAAMPKTPDEAKVAGWKLMRDKNGNRAYVGPDGKFVEVK